MGSGSLKRVSSYGWDRRFFLHTMTDLNRPRIAFAMLQCAVTTRDGSLREEAIAEREMRGVYPQSPPQFQGWNPSVPFLLAFSELN
jgi:hypothetical protein